MCYEFSAAWRIVAAWHGNSVRARNNGSLTRSDAAQDVLAGRAADVLLREAWDIVHPWSGIAEECLTRRVPNARYLLMRGPRGYSDPGGIITAGTGTNGHAAGTTERVDDGAGRA